MFDVERFVTECREVVESGGGREGMTALIERTVSEPGAVLAGLGEPERAGVQRLHVADDLTVLNIVWGPHMTLMPHTHEMWAVIGIYTGREDNIFWRRLPDDAYGTVKATGARALAAKDVASLGPEVIHSVTNPVPRLTGAIHVYGGNFFETPRSEWDPETLHEGPYDVNKTLRIFEEANALTPAA